MALIHHHGMGKVLIFSTYLWTGEGMTIRNIGLVKQILSMAHRLGLPWIAGGDWQMSPEELVGGPWVLGYQVKASSPPYGTCRCVKTGVENLIDYFLAGTYMASLLSQATRDEEAVTSPHWPVSVVIDGRPRQYVIKSLLAPKQFPLGRPVGPCRQPPAYTMPEIRCTVTDQEEDQSRSWLRCLAGNRSRPSPTWAGRHQQGWSKGL